MKVTLFLRNSKYFSLENVTYTITENLECKYRIYKLLKPSKGIINRIFNLFEVIKYQSDVNHITGDIHYVSLLMKKKKTIITMHDCEILMQKKLNPLKRFIYKLIWFTLPSYRCNKIIAISKESKRQLIKYAKIPAKKIKVIHDPVNDLFKPISITQKEKKKALHNPTGKKTILHISNGNSNKNTIRIAKALSDLDIKYIRIGTLNSNELKILQDNKTDCLFLNKISSEKLCRIYNSVDCLIFPSLVEGFGLPVIEAQKCECPVITSNISSLPEVAGSGAMFVNPHYVDEIRTGILKVLNDSKYRSKIIKEGSVNAERFNDKAISKEYESLYKVVYNKSKRKKNKIN